MKRIFTLSAALFTTLLMFSILSGCVTINPGGEQPNPAPSPSPLPPPVATTQPARTGLTDERLMNAEYSLTAAPGAGEPGRRRIFG